MEKDLARDMMAEIMEFNEGLNKVIARIEMVADESEKKQLRSAMGQIFGNVYTGLMRPIIRQYPDLDPDPVIQRPIQWPLQTTEDNDSTKASYEFASEL